jgi:hypothetical protein
MVLEAKSAKSSYGFYDIEMQTAFPIFALLQLQENLLKQVRNSGVARKPLVWFLANRGDTWHGYGSYVTDSEPPRYVSTLQTLFFQFLYPMQDRSEKCQPP